MLTSLVHINANLSQPPTLAILRGKTPGRSEVMSPRHFLRPRFSVSLSVHSVPSVVKRGPPLEVPVPPEADLRQTQKAPFRPRRTSEPFPTWIIHATSLAQMRGAVKLPSRPPAPPKEPTIPHTLLFRIPGSPYC